MKPVVTSLVHYVAFGATCLAGIVTAVSSADPMHVDVTAFPGGLNKIGVDYDEAKDNGTWHWPEPADPIGQEQQT